MLGLFDKNQKPQETIIERERKRERQDSNSSYSSSSSSSDMYTHDSSLSKDECLKPTVSVITLSSDKPSFLVIVLTALASISGFMFGYDTGYISCSSFDW